VPQHRKSACRSVYWAVDQPAREVAQEPASRSSCTLLLLAVTRWGLVVALQDRHQVQEAGELAPIAAGSVDERFPLVTRRA
jgi:hypothetical protein